MEKERKMKKAFNTIAVGTLMALPLVAIFAIWARDGMPY